EVDGGDAQMQIGSHNLSRLPLDGGLPECLPGTRFHFLLRLLGSPRENPAFVLDIPFSLVALRLLLQQLSHAGVTRPLRSARSPRNEIAQVIAGDCKKPSPKRPA